MGNNLITEKFNGVECVDLIDYEPHQQYTNRQNTIFVSIASYRDVECSDTIESLFSNAEYPGNVFVGICEQNKSDNDSEKCLRTDISKKYANNIRIVTLDHTQAKGPTYARYHCSRLWRGEEYYLQIDSHTHFAKNWDTDLIHMIRQVKSLGVIKPVLSAYPPTKEQMDIAGFPEMDNGKFIGEVPSFLSGWSSESKYPKLSKKPWVAAGLMFLESYFLYSVPFDPMLSHVFNGEEVLFSARLWTNGWDIYTPNKKVLYHHYNRKESPMYYKDNNQSGTCRSKAEKRMHYILGLVDINQVEPDFRHDIEYYSLGNERSLDDYWKLAKVDFKQKKIHK